MEYPVTPQTAEFTRTGVLPLHKFDADPSTDAAGTWPSGMFGYYVSGTSIFLAGYDDETGWVAVELTP